MGQMSDDVKIVLIICITIVVALLGTTFIVTH